MPKLAHFDTLANDPEQAKSFYARLLVFFKKIKI